MNDVVVVSYEMMYKWDPSASQRIRQRVRKYAQPVYKKKIFMIVSVLIATFLNHFPKP